MTDKPAATPGQGHNSQSQLRSYVERIANLMEEIKAIADDIKDMKAEIKAAGFDASAISYAAKVKCMDSEKREKFFATQEKRDAALVEAGLAP